MTKNSHLAVSDLLDIVEEITGMLEELNPGAAERVRRIRFLIERAEKRITKAMDSE